MWFMANRSRESGEKGHEGAAHYQAEIRAGASSDGAPAADGLASRTEKRQRSERIFRRGVRRDVR